MLKECSMDPNETAQKLLVQGRPLTLSSSPAPLTPIPGISFSGRMRVLGVMVLSCESSISIRKIVLLHPGGAFGAADRFYWVGDLGVLTGIFFFSSICGFALRCWVAFMIAQPLICTGLEEFFLECRRHCSVVK